jgi:autophagy-related protein 9
MRKENYLIALFNEDLLDLRVRVPVPKALERFFPASWVKSAPNSGLPHAGPFTDQKFLTLGDNTLTYALESNLRYCLLAYFFDVHGQVRRDVVRGGNRADLVKK